MRVLITTLLYCIFIFPPVDSGDFWEIRSRTLLIKRGQTKRLMLGFEQYCNDSKKKISKNLTYDSTEEAKNWRYGRLHLYVKHDGRKWLNGTRIFRQEYRIWNETWHLRNISLRKTAYYIAQQMAHYGDVCQVTHKHGELRYITAMKDKSFFVCKDYYSAISATKTKFKLHPRKIMLIYNYNISWSDTTDESYNVWDHIVQRLIRSNKVAIKVPIQCDGPCGRLTDDYVQFGLCEHTVCRDCYENAHSADHEGVHGCCNSECLMLWKMEERRRKKKARKEEKIRAKRVRSDISYCMKYDDKSFEHLMERLRKSQKSSGVSTRTGSVTSSRDTLYSQINVL